MCHLTRSTVSTLLTVAILIGTCSACAPLRTPTHASPAAAKADANTEGVAYDDPFAYCAAVGTVDAPDARYGGPEMPDSIIQGMIRQGIVSAEAPPDFQKSACWRCMDGRVWVCHYGANLPCEEKADAAQAPTSEMETFCEANPQAEVIPAAVTGRATVYEWRCSDGKPEVVRQVFQIDPRGYLADFWYELPPG